jgi:3-oxo-5-alpha-steroid 4-dehydrogenase 1
VEALIPASVLKLCPAALLSYIGTYSEEEAHAAAAYLMIAVGMCVIFVELVVGARATYGRYSSNVSARYYGPQINAKFAWFFQESCFLVAPLALLLGDGRFFERRPACLASAPNRALLFMFLGHYVYRSFVYPLRMRGGKPMPVGICALAATFGLYNGAIQGRAWTSIAVRTLEGPADTAAFALGAAVWAAGLGINYHSDGVLRELRKPGETGYKIPRGGAFELVSGANYFGEIVEWCGYALASRHVAGWAFAFFTFANTAPRAYHHHIWYRSKFEDYPKARRAVIPFVW